MIKFEIYRSGILRKSWKWRAVASNGEIMASGRGLNSKQGAVDSVSTLTRYVKQGLFSLKFV